MLLNGWYICWIVWWDEMRMTEQNRAIEELFIDCEASLHVIPTFHDDDDLIHPSAIDPPLQLTDGDRIKLDILATPSMGGDDSPSFPTSQENISGSKGRTSLCWFAVNKGLSVALGHNFPKHGSKDKSTRERGERGSSNGDITTPCSALS